MFPEYKKSDFEINHIIGEGVNSIVYQGHLDGKKIAIKELQNNYISFKEHLYDELKILRKLKSNHYFINILGTCRVKDIHYILMEYFDSDLFKYIDRFWKASIQYQGIISPIITTIYYYKDGGDDRYNNEFYWSYSMDRIEKVYITKQLLSSVFELHSMNIIHGDIKSENFVYMNNILKMIDFNTSSDVGSKKEIKIECKFGTEGYIAPEQYENKLSYKSDIYSICVTILELWCGRIWFKDTTDFKSNRNEIMKSLRLLGKDEKKLSKILRKNISLKENYRCTIFTLLKDVDISI